jgi:hypothetical protein
VPAWRDCVSSEPTSAPSRLRHVVTLYVQPSGQRLDLGMNLGMMNLGMT